MKQIALLTIALIVGLGSLGVAYAAWTDQVTIAGTVSTGVMRVEWDEFFIRDSGSGHHSPADLPEYVTASAQIGSDPQIATITIENLYPMPSEPAWHLGDRVAVSGFAKNLGTIPVVFTGAELSIVTNENDVAEYMRADLRVATRIDGSWKVVVVAEGVPLKKLDEAFDDAIGEGVLKTGDLFGLGEETMYLYLDQSAPNETMNSTLEFTLKFHFVQWNA